MSPEDPFSIDLPAEPYPGLRSFEADEWTIFFGRERMIDEVIERIALNRLILIHGASGSGKSSLVRAGVLPKLERQHRAHDSPWLTFTMRPSGGPLWNLAVEFARRNGKADDLDHVSSIVRQFSESGASLASILSRLEGFAGQSVCILVDQFEELFRYEKTSREVAETFVDLIVRAASPPEGAADGPDVRLIVTMRSEYLGECARFYGLAEVINETQYLVPRMEDEALTRTVRRPAELYGAVVGDEVARRLIVSVCGREDELPLLQHGLMMMWRDAAGRTPAGARKVLSDTIVSEAGGLAGLLSQHADNVMDAVAPDGARARIVESLFRELTEVNTEGKAVRRPRRLADLVGATGASADELKTILDAFRDPDVAFLTPYKTEAIEDRTDIDISHEALIRCWRRISSPRDGWLRREFDDGLAWRSLLTEARAFKDDANHLLSDASAKDRTRLYALHNERWSQRYGGGWGLVGGLLEASRNAASRAQWWSRAAMASIATLAVAAIGSAAMMHQALEGRKAEVAQRVVDEVKLQEALTLATVESENLMTALDRQKDAEDGLNGALTREKDALARLQREDDRLKDAIEQSDSQMKLTSMLMIQITQKGKACPKNITGDKALIEQAKSAAQRGSAGANYLIGMLYECGLGVPRDGKQAFAYNRKAADSGYDLAMWFMGNWWEDRKDYVAARGWYEQAAASENGAAMGELGFFYYRGLGVDPDTKAARAWFEKGAQAGDAHAVRNLGVMWEKGDGGAQDYARARDLYEKASVAGDSDAAVDLALLVVSGRGGPKDPARAHDLLQTAATAGSDRARRRLDELPFAADQASASDAMSLKDYRTAADRYANVARRIEGDERKNGGVAGPRTAHALGDLAFATLLIRKFQLALEASTRAHALAPGESWIEMNHAHALMFLGRTKEARELYDRHHNDSDIGMSLGDWQPAVLDDFRQFREAGLTNPLMNEIAAEYSTQGSEKHASGAAPQ